MIKLVAVKHPEAEIKLVAIEDHKVPNFINGLGAGFRLGLLVAFCFEGYDSKELSRLLSEVTGPGRNLDGSIIETPV